MQIERKLGASDRAEDEGWAQRDPRHPARQLRDEHERRDRSSRPSDVDKYFGRNQVLRGVSLDVGSGEVVCIIGPSGSGKTTFLRCINHLERIDGGRIEVNGHLIGYRHGKRTARSSRTPSGTSRASAPRSASSSSGSTSGRTRPRSRTSSRRPSGAEGAADEAVAQGEALLERVGLADKRDAYPGQAVRRPAAARRDRTRPRDATRR